MQDIQEIIKEIKKQKEYYNKEKIRLKQEISQLSKGSIQKRIIKNNTYYYLQYRNKGKITQDYIGNKVPPELQKQITKRQRLETKLRPINDQLKLLRKFKV